ncbi:MAG TPA: hypothetical protein VFA12_02155 [Stellaceae bacterium]|nr:hypothetical protein [Stellaceae bacterium]
MSAIKSAVIVSLLSLATGCAPAGYPKSPAYAPEVVEQPQRVDFFYGWVIAVRPVDVKFGDGGGISAGILPAPPLPVIGAGYAQGPNWSGGGIRVGGARLFAGGVVPNVPAREYTVLLDKNIYPLDPFLGYGQRPAIVVVQNDYAGDPPLPVNARALVRVIGNVAHVMPAAAIPPALERTLSAGPLPVPLTYEPPSPQHYYPPSVSVGMR